LIDTAEQKRAVFQIGFVERFNPAVVALEKVIGRPLFIETGNEDLFKRAKKQAAHRLIGKGVGPGLAETAVTR